MSEHPGYDGVITLCDVFTDTEAVVLAHQNRVRSLLQGGASPAAREVVVVRSHVEVLEAELHQLELALRRAVRALPAPVATWVTGTVGVGLKQGARLIGSIGDPAWNANADRLRRGPAELWAYCGLHTVPADQHRVDIQGPGVGGDQASAGGDADQLKTDAQSGYVGVAARRAKGQRANWNGQAKSRAYLVAESCVKQRHSPYRAVYDARREATRDRVHAAPCVRCGPSGKPAQPGTTWNPGHQHADALRVVSKAILRDLWRAARAAHRDLEVNEAA